MKGHYIILISLFFVFALSVPASASYEFHHLWGSEDNHYIVTVAAGTDVNGNIINYPAVARPVGILADGSSLNDFINRGVAPAVPLEAVYISTGNFGKGVIDINPQDGSYANLGGNRIGSAIPSGIGPVNSSVVVYKISTTNDNRLSNIYLTTETGNIVAVRADLSSFQSSGNGSQLYPIHYSSLWSAHLNGSISHSVAIFRGAPYDTSDDRVLVSTDDGDVAAFYPNNGTMIWNSNLEGSGFYSPAPVDSANMTLMVSKNGKIYALNMSDGSSIWHSDLGKEIRSFSVSDSVNENCNSSSLFFVGTDRGEIQGIHLLDGQLGPKISLKHSVPVSALFCTASLNCMIFGGTEEYKDGVGYVFSINKEGDSLKIIWDKDIYGEVSAAPAYFDNRFVYFSTSAGILYAFRVDSGEPVFVLHSVSSPLNTVIVAPQIPGMNPVYKAVIGAHKDGSLFSISTDAKYMDDGSDSDDFPSESSSTHGTAFPGFVPTIVTVAISVILFRRFRRN